MYRIQDEILNILVAICKEEGIRTNQDIHLFEAGLLDSMGIVELLVEIEEKLNMKISITEFDREEWATPNKIISFIEHRVA